jgi:hypothetical protein
LQRHWTATSGSGRRYKRAARGQGSSKRVCTECDREQRADGSVREYETRRDEDEAGKAKEGAEVKMMQCRWPGWKLVR